MGHVFRAGKRPLSVNVAEWQQVAAPLPIGAVLWILAGTNPSPYSITFPTKIVLYPIPVSGTKSSKNSSSWQKERQQI
jgi:hypothetical protein